MASEPLGRIGILTAGGHAPCLAAAVGALIERYYESLNEVEILCYRGGYLGLLTDDYITVTPEIARNAHIIFQWGGSPIGNSRVKLTNVADCVKRGLVKEGEDPQLVAAENLKRNRIQVLHTVGGDDTNVAAAALAKFLDEHGYKLRVIGLPKTIDNDVFPVKRTLGAWTAAEQTAKFFENVVTECGASRRMLIVHEVMGRHCGYLTAKAACMYRERLGKRAFLPALGIIKDKYDIHGIYIPEVDVKFEVEAERLSRVMHRYRNVNVFVAEGACVPEVIKDLEARGEAVPKDAFGHVSLDKVNVGSWFATHFARMIGADKVLVQKSGYFARSAPANVDDLWMIKGMADKAVEVAMTGGQGVIGNDEERNGALRVIEFDRIRGGKPFDTSVEWFQDMIAEIETFGHKSLCQHEMSFMSLAQRKLLLDREKNVQQEQQQDDEGS